MKAIMISIKPQWVERILNGEKTIEIRKTKPNCELPAKVYIYCTKGKQNLYIPQEFNAFECDDWSKPYFAKKPILEDVDYLANGKVIAEFTLNEVEDFSKWEYDFGALVRCLDLWAGTKGNYPFLIDYLKGQKKGYAWHIDNLKIYGNPKELSEFRKRNKCHYADYDEGCCFECCTFYDLGDCDGKYSKLERPPQSWCYVGKAVEDE